MSALPDLTKPLVKLSDPFGILPKETQRQISDPLNMVSKPITPAGPTQEELTAAIKTDINTRRAAAANQAATTNSSLSRASLGAQVLGS